MTRLDTMECFQTTDDGLASGPLVVADDYTVSRISNFLVLGSWTVSYMQ